MAIKNDSERVVEEYYQNSEEDYLIYLFHMIAYEFATSYVENKTVLDFGSGSGYGSHFLAPSCKRITGVDISSEAVEYAREKYKAPNLTFMKIDVVEAAPLPFEDSSFDTVISFQVIEHVHDVQAYLSEIRRVLKKGGVFICATPDRSSRLIPGHKPWNMWHVHEYDQAELYKLLGSYFSKTQVLMQGGKREVIDIEIRRTKKVMWMTYPLTLPFLPEFIRLNGLYLIKKFSKITKKVLGKRSQKVTKDFSFQLSDLSIDNNLNPSVNLVAVSYKA